MHVQYRWTHSSLGVLNLPGAHKCSGLLSQDSLMYLYTDADDHLPRHWVVGNWTSFAILIVTPPIHIECVLTVSKYHRVWSIACINADVKSNWSNF